MKHATRDKLPLLCTNHLPAMPVGTPGVGWPMGSAEERLFIVQLVHHRLVTPNRTFCSVDFPCNDGCAATMDTVRPEKGQNTNTTAFFNDLDMNGFVKVKSKNFRSCDYSNTSDTSTIVGIIVWS